MSKASFVVRRQDVSDEFPVEYSKCTLMKIGLQNEAVGGQFRPIPDACGIKLQHQELLKAHLHF